jgi:hypothetical protein
VLEIRPCCEHCGRDLPNTSPDARICTFECTFCATCADGVLGGVCPNCTGNFERRPVRPAAALEGAAAATERRHSPVDLVAHAERLRSLAR